VPKGFFKFSNYGIKDDFQQVEKRWRVVPLRSETFIVGICTLQDLTWYFKSNGVCQVLGESCTDVYIYYRINA
jgi:hypothetical protein